MEKKIIKEKLRLEGVACTACETKIEDALKDKKGIKSVKVSYAESTLDITYDAEIITIGNIIKIVEKLNYKVVQESKEVKARVEKKSYQQIIVIGIIVLGIYLIVKNTIGFNFIPEITPNMGYGILFVIGLLTSLHCVAMCGGINLSVCMSYKFDDNDNHKWSKLWPSMMYNAGRVISYTIIGGIVGAIGSAFRISNKGSAFIAIAAGVFMVIMGLNMLQVFPWLRKINPHMPKIFAQKIHREKKGKGPFVVGVLNGFMPCGPLQAMQLYALGTGSFIAGALSMFIFSLGTIPLLFAFGALGSLLSVKATKNMLKLSAVLVMLLGVVMVNRGLAFTGFTMDSFAKAASSISSTANTNGNSGTKTNSDKNDENTALVNGDVQEITSELESNSYPILTVQKGIPVKWTIHANASNLNGCNGEIIIPKYNIRQKLVEGDNVITFTPNESGKFGYSCWMGMIRSNITVTDQATDVQTNKVDSAPIDNTGMPAGCCSQ
ncbi:MAG: sulfite exporter TauE/SafE family protein [Lachnospiraceae bacterium]|nr:sulfite exporter TauE/SafE family protein [Lachnospiraceae bacterium]